MPAASDNTLLAELMNPETTAQHRRWVWWLLAAALAWGAMIGVGAYLQDPRRGYMVFAVVLLFGLAWAGLLVMFRRRGEGRKPPAEKLSDQPDEPQEIWKP